MSDRISFGVSAGSTDVSLPVELRLSASSLEKTATAHSDVTASYWRQGGSRTSITMVNLGAITDAHSDGGWEEVDATNMPGVYRFDVPDAAFSSGADWVIISLKVATCFVESFMFSLTTGVNARSMGADVITAASIASDAVTELQSGLSTLTAAGIRTAVGLASSNLDTQLTTIDDLLDTEIAAIISIIGLIKAKTDLLPANPANISDIEGLLDLSAGVETGLTVREALRGIAAVLLGKSSNSGATFRDVGDTKERVAATVDGSGNRTAITRDLT